MILFYMSKSYFEDTISSAQTEWRACISVPKKSKIKQAEFENKTREMVSSK